MNAKQRREVVNQAREDFTLPDIPLAETDAALFGEIAEVDSQLATITGGKLQIGGIRLTRKGLEVHKTATLDDFEQVGNILEPFADSLRWLIGDWLVLGERTFKKTTEELAARFKKAKGTIYNWTSVCKQVDISRRREELDFTFHVEVAALSPSEQTRFLKKAVDEKWSTRQLRAFIETGDPTPPSVDKVVSDATIPPRPLRNLQKKVLKGQSGDVKSKAESLSQISQLRAWLDAFERMLK